MEFCEELISAARSGRDGDDLTRVNSVPVNASATQAAAAAMELQASRW
jgi:hypothetical protein